MSRGKSPPALRPPVLTTSKDLVKLQGRLALPLAELPIRTEPEAGFFDWLDGRLAEIEESL